MNYYKITNELENHHGLQYQDGLNVDILPFKPSGNCEPGGIYFARKDILGFLNQDGVWLRKVILPEGEEVYKNPGVSEKFKAHSVIFEPRIKIDFNVIKELIEEGANIHAEEGNILRWAVFKGDVTLVEFLINNGADINERTNYIQNIELAVENNDIYMTKFLIDNKANISTHESRACYLASYYGFLDILKLLVENNEDEKPNYANSLLWAKNKNQTEVVQYLEEIINNNKNEIKS